MKLKIKEAFAFLSNMGKDERLESIIKSLLVSLLIGITLGIFMGWFTCNERIFYDIGEYSEGKRVERIESYFNYQSGFIFGSISTLLVFIRRLSSGKTVTNLNSK
jgi:hypothetical protein